MFPLLTCSANQAFQFGRAALLLSIPTSYTFDRVKDNYLTWNLSVSQMWTQDSEPHPKCLSSHSTTLPRAKKLQFLKIWEDTLLWKTAWSQKPNRPTFHIFVKKRRKRNKNKTFLLLEVFSSETFVRIKDEDACFDFCSNPPPWMVVAANGNCFK